MTGIASNFHQSTTQTAALLAHDSLPAHEVKRALHIFGYQGETPHLLDVLQLAADLSPQFAVLRHDLPALSPTIDGFLSAPTLLKNALAITAPAHSEGVNQSPAHKTEHRFSLMSGAVGKLLRDYDQEISSGTAGKAIQDMLALLWVTTTIPPDQDDCKPSNRSKIRFPPPPLALFTICSLIFDSDSNTG
ncbi:MAG: hypothetical protein HZC24_05950, partial [Rhodocyclales bacterium]|nr:hypothetical protein [Rhodocyclales bacterium]